MPAAPQPHPRQMRFSCPGCCSPVTGWLRPLPSLDLLCDDDETSLLPHGYALRRDDRRAAPGRLPGFASFPWLIAPESERRLRPHPDAHRTIGCCGLSYRGESEPNLTCPRGHEIAIGYRDCCGPHWYALAERAAVEWRDDPAPLGEVGSRVSRAAALVDAPLPPLARYANGVDDVWHDDDRARAPRLAGPRLAAGGGEAPTLVITSPSLPDGSGIFLPLPRAALVRALALDEEPCGSPEVPMTMQRTAKSPVLLSCSEGVVLLTAGGRDEASALAVSFDEGEWRAAWGDARRLASGQT